jgi:hypothetical protein
VLAVGALGNQGVNGVHYSYDNILALGNYEHPKHGNETTKLN